MNRSSRTAARRDCSPRSRSNATNSTRSTSREHHGGCAGGKDEVDPGVTRVRRVEDDRAEQRPDHAVPRVVRHAPDTRDRQCTMSSGPHSKATANGPMTSAESANPTTAARITAASAVADHSLGKNAN